MAKKIYTTELVIGTAVSEDAYFCTSVQMVNSFTVGAAALNGYVLELQDRKGGVKLFVSLEDAPENILELAQNVIIVNGIVLKNDEIFLKSTAQVRIAQKEEFNSKDLILGISDNKKAAFMSLLKKELLSVNKESYSKLLSSIFTMENIEKMAEYPMSLKTYGNYHGGLLVATASIVQICNNLVKSFEILNNGVYSSPAVDKDLLFTAGLLHGVGKLWEYTPFPYKKSYEGMMNGTICTLQRHLECDECLSQEDAMALMSVIIPACDAKSQIKAVSKEALILQQAVNIYKACDERDRVVFDYVGTEDIFFSQRLNAYVENRKVVS